MEGVQKKFYTLQEAQYALACSRSTLYNLIKSRDLVRVYRDSTPLITSASVDEYADKLGNAGRKQARRLLGRETAAEQKLRRAS